MQEIDRQWRGIERRNCTLKTVEYPPAIQHLVSYLKRLPGIGPRSAERIAIWMLNGRQGNFAKEMSPVVQMAAEGVKACGECGFFTSHEEPCAVCSDSERDGQLLCVVEQPTDILPLEKTRAFLGHYHCLGGRISPLDNIGPEDLRISTLVSRLKLGGFTEVILALGSDVEGEATANYLSEMFETQFSGLAVTQLAQGLPAGGGLEHADELTLFRALDGRKKVR